MVGSKNYFGCYQRSGGKNRAFSEIMVAPNVPMERDVHLLMLFYQSNVPTGHSVSLSIAEQNCCSTSE